MNIKSIIFSALMISTIFSGSVVIAHDSDKTSIKEKLLFGMGITTIIGTGAMVAYPAGMALGRAAAYVGGPIIGIAGAILGTQVGCLIGMAMGLAVLEALDKKITK